mgnify:FL=1
MKNLLKCRQNKWSEIGKDFFAKMRKNTCILIGFNTYKMRKSTQEFSNIEFCNLLKMNKIQNQEKIKMNKIYQGLGNARSIC